MTNSHLDSHLEVKAPMAMSKNKASDLLKHTCIHEETSHQILVLNISCRCFNSVVKTINKQLINNEKTMGVIFCLILEIVICEDRPISYK